ncbi:MAG: hypothetical protein FWG63_12720 [Defluviitaleaceae bacterium]|nr:hypothetical protein [Defluviitaleaceae bacterium]
MKIKIKTKKMILGFGMAIAIILLSGCTNGLYLGYTDYNIDGVYDATQQNEVGNTSVPILFTDTEFEQITQQNNEHTTSETADDSFDYENFLELLTANGFSFEEGQIFPGGSMTAPLSAMAKFVYVEGEMLRVEIYDSNEIMEKASILIHISGVASPDWPNFLTFKVTWMPEASPRWFKRGSLIIFYGGNDSRVIDFLVENLTFFVGFDIDFFVYTDE